MSAETSTWLNTKSLIGMTANRGNAWHYRAEDQGAESNHYDGAIPVADVARRLFNWEPLSVPVSITLPASYEDMTTVDADGKPVKMVTVADRQAIVHPHTLETFGVFKGGYTIHSYQTWLLNEVSNILSDTLSVSSAGLLRGGAIAWVEVSVPDTIETPEGVTFRPNLLAATSLDGSLSTTYKRTITNTVCHAKGTPAIDGDWRGNVEDHPSAIGGIIKPGYEVTVKGLPFSERITEEHRYWARQCKRTLTAKRQLAAATAGTATLTRTSVGQDVEAGWVEARDLQPVAHEIGTPIDTREIPAPAVQIATVHRGRPSSTLWHVGVEPRLADPEWLWLIGLWWGDGHLSLRDGSVTLSVAHTQPEIAERVERLARSVGWKGTATRGEGCDQITFYDQTLCALLAEWKGDGRAVKTPPVWVETLPLDLQRALVQGYYAADGNTDTTEGAILASVNLNGLLALRRILSRLGIPASIRKGSDPALRSVVQGRTVNAQPQWSIRFWRNVAQLGMTTRFTGAKGSHPYIEDGWLWSRVETVEPVIDEFWPITTATHEYVTAFGRSHNCDNTMSAALGEAGQQIKIKHSRYSAVKLTDARAALAMVERTAGAFEDQVRRLCATEVTAKQWEAFLETLNPIPADKGRARTNAETKRSELSRLWNSDNRVEPWRNTAWGAVQAVNTYDHHIVGVRGATRAERNMDKAVYGAFDTLDTNTLTTLNKVLATV